MALPKNPELEHVAEVAQRTIEAQGGIRASTVHHKDAPKLHVHEQQAATGAPADGLYVTTAIPNLHVRVLPGQHVRVPEGHEVGKPGDYFEGGEFDTHGPTAHMLEARGIVEVIGGVE